MPESTSPKYLPNNGYIVWIPAGHSYYVYPTPEPVEADEEPPDGASSD